MTTKSINRPHKPNCAYLCSGEEQRPCDCDAVTQPRLTLSLGVQSVNLLRRAIGRLDTDDQRAVAELGLKDALEDFAIASAPLPLEGQLRMASVEDFTADLASLKKITERLDVVSMNFDLPVLISNKARFAASELREAENELKEMVEALAKAKARS